MLTVSEAAALLRSFDRVLILTHIRPDGDTVGCAAGLCAALRTMGKTAYLLPNPGLTENTAPYFTPYSAPADFVPEKVVSTDIATVGLFPDNAKSYADKVDLAIDHHPSFEGFGKANIVRPEAAACGELILDIVRELTPLTPEIALPLYVAISTDTGGFIYSNVTAATHRAAAELMDTGIDYRAVNKLFFQTKSRVRMQLEAAMLAEAKFYDNNRTAVLSVPQSLLEKFHATESDAEDLSALGPQIQGVDCAVTMRELGDGVWKFSLRTGERVNATEVCRLLGGGGHARAAGATLEGVTQAEAEEKMLNAIALRLDIHGCLRQDPGNPEGKAGRPWRHAGSYGHRRSAGVCGTGYPCRRIRGKRRKRVYRRSAAGAGHQHPGYVRGNAGDPSRHCGPGGVGSRPPPLHRPYRADPAHVFRHQDQRPKAL